MSKSDYKNFEQAINQGDAENVESILSSNSKAYNKVLFKETDALGLACAYGHVECARVLIKYGAQVSRYDNAETSPLHSACAKGHVECVQLLIDHGAPIDEVTDDFDGCDKQDRTALHMACDSAYGNAGNIEKCIRLLINHGANINAQDASGETPLHYAYNSPRLIMTLLELGAKPDIKNRQGHTALDKARDDQYRRPNEYCIKLLSQHNVR
jgi:ankyrin repeat protein